MNVRELIRRGPGQLLEFFLDPEAETLAETLVSLANADGGTILVGLDAGGEQQRDLAPEHLEAVLTHAQGLCRPIVACDWQPLEADGNPVTAIIVPRSPDLHSLSDGRVLLRSGSRNRPLSGEEIRHLASAKGTGDFEQQLSSASLADLDEQLIADFAGRRRQRGARGEKLEGSALLEDSGAIGPGATPTTAGLLLFGRAPQRFLPQAGAVLVHFAGTSAGGRDGQPGYSRREEVDGPMGRVIERLWELIQEEMRHASVINGLRREEQPEYPLPAVREAVVNAVAHRDYRLAGRRIEVRMFDDRLEIISPGGLPGHITLDNIVEEHFSRNPRLVKGLYYWGLIEELGLGIDRMIDEMLQAGHPAPQFEATPFTFKVTLYNARERAASKWETLLSERQLKALHYLRDHDRITNREYHDLCPDVSAETLRLDLVDMVERGVLLRIGDKKGTYYILK